MITTISIDGMRSVHCARAIYTALAGVPDVRNANVTIGRATIEHEVPLDATALCAAVESLGYAVVAIDVERRRLLLHDASDGAPEPLAPSPPESRVTPYIENQ